jgi:hypothetical protein
MPTERMEIVDYPNSHIAAANLHENRLELAKRIGSYPLYTPPAPGHYWGLYLWDEAFHAIIDARHGTTESLTAASAGIRTLIAGQREDGFIPNFQNLGPRRRIDPESLFGYESAEHSNYIQPPVLALAVAEVTKALYRHNDMDKSEDESPASDLLSDFYPSLKLFYEYFDKYRSSSPDDRRIFIIHPHETGRDSDPTFDYLKPYRLNRRGLDTPLIIDKANIVLDYLQIVEYGIRLRRVNGDMQKARELCGTLDVMMNCILVDNLDVMATLAKKLGKTEDAEYFSKYAREVEDKILTKMWFSAERAGHGAFYAIKGDGEPIKEISISNIFPLLLPNLSEDQLESVLDLMDASFDTPFPLPSVATDSPNYDPHNRESDRLWRTGVWGNANWYINERGLRKQRLREELAHRQDLLQRCDRWSDRVTGSSLSLLAMNGPMEFYNPVTGEGQRKRVKNFAWSNLGYVIKPCYLEDLSLEH